MIYWPSPEKPFDQSSYREIKDSEWFHCWRIYATQEYTEWMWFVAHGSAYPQIRGIWRDYPKSEV